MNGAPKIKLEHLRITPERAAQLAQEEKNGESITLITKKLSKLLDMPFSDETPHTEQLWNPDEREQLVRHLFTFATKLAPELPKYDLIVGDDASGRLLARFVWRLAEAARDQAHATNPKLIFLAADEKWDKPGNNEVKQAAAQKIKNYGHERTLFVSEFAHSGKTAMMVAGIARQLNAPIDIGLLSSAMSRFDEEHLYTITDQTRSNVLIGTANSWAGANLFEFSYGDKLTENRKIIIGVEKHETEMRTHTVRRPNNNPEILARSRAAMNLLADEIAPLVLPQEGASALKQAA